MTKKHLLSLGFICVWGCLESPAQGADPEKLQPEISELTGTKAKELYQQANALYMEEKYAPAYILYKAAWDLRHHYKIAANLGICEFALRKYRDSAEHLAFSLQEMPRDAPAEERKYYNEQQIEAVKHVGTLEIHIADAGAADVFIDDKPIGKAPLKGPIYVEPGQRTVHARNKLSSGSELVNLKPGTSKSIVLHVLPPPTRAPARPEPSTTPGSLFGFGVGLGAVLVSIGVAFSIIYPGYKAPSAFTEQTTFALSTGFLASGGLVVGGTAVAAFWAAHDTPKSPQIQVAPRVGLTSNAWFVGVETRF